MLDVNKFNRYFHKSYYIVKNTGEIIPIYLYNYEGIFISYNTSNLKLKVRGRIIKLSDYNNRVNNLDVLIKTNTLDAVLDKLNSRIESLIGNQINIDIRYFKVSHIEICMNFKTQYVNQYISLFNTIFLYNQKNGKFNRYKNYIIEENKANDTSFNITTNSQFENKTKVNYTVNFYNKLNQLSSLLKKSKTETKYKYVKVTENDLVAAINILRLEVQCSYQYLRNFKKKFNVDNDDRILKTFFDLDLCKKILIDKYTYFINDICNDFYSYKEAIEIIQNSNKKVFIRTKADTLSYIKAISQNAVHSQYKSHNTRKTYNTILFNHKISQYLIPKKFNINKLEGLNGLLLNKYYIDTTTVLINNKKVEQIENNGQEELEINNDLIERYIINDELDEEEKTEKCIFKDCRNEAIYGKSGYCEYHYKQSLRTKTKI